MPREHNKLTERQVNKRDRLLAEFLQQHKGTERAVGRKEIAKFLTEHGYKQKESTVNMLVKKVMFKRRLPICEINSRGYYWAQSKKDFEDTISDLEKRINSMTERIAFLKSFIFE